MKVTMESTENNSKNDMISKGTIQKLCKHRKTMYFRRI